MNLSRAPDIPAAISRGPWWLGCLARAAGACRSSLGRKLALIFPAVILAGCETVPVLEEAAARPPEACPPIVVSECPVCEARACPAPPVIEKIVQAPPPEPPKPPEPVTAGKLDLPVIGAVEWASLDPPEMRLRARMDTGAEITLLQVQSLSSLEKDGDRYIQFTLQEKGSDPFSVERKLRKRVSVPLPTGGMARLPVVQLWVSVGESRALIDVALTDEGEFEYPLVVGRNFLTDLAIVDVSQRHTLD